MSYKILHILDCYLPETMNWLERLLEESMNECEHHIYASFYISTLNSHFKYVNINDKSSYPIPFLSKLKNQFLHSQNAQLLSNYIHENNIQIIHFHFGNVAIKYKQWIKNMNLPFCISLYGFDYEYLVHKNKRVKSDYEYLAKLGGNYLVEGNYSKALIRNYGIPHAQIYIVHMLFDRKWKTKINKYSQPIRLFQAATFTEKKNQLGLVDALQDRHASQFEISFYGENADKKYYEELKKAIKTKPNHCIRIQDKISLPKYLQALNATHFTVNLSKRSSSHDTEGGCPVLLKDSLSLGKPVITSKHCDIPELVASAYNGFLLPENDTQAITDLLDQLMLLTQKQYIKLCNNAKETVETNIQQHLMKQDLIRAYQSMI